MELLLGRVH